LRSVGSWACATCNCRTGVFLHIDVNKFGLDVVPDNFHYDSRFVAAQIVDTDRTSPSLDEAWFRIAHGRRNLDQEVERYTDGRFLFFCCCAEIDGTRAYVPCEGRNMPGADG